MACIKADMRVDVVLCRIMQHYFATIRSHDSEMHQQFWHPITWINITSIILDSTWVVIDSQWSLLTICSKCIGGPCQAKVRLSRHISWKEFDCNAQSNFMTSNSRCKAPFFNDTDPDGPALISWNGREKFGKGSVWWHQRTHSQHVILGPTTLHVWYYTSQLPSLHTHSIKLANNHLQWRLTLLHIHEVIRTNNEPLEIAKMHEDMSSKELNLETNWVVHLTPTSCSLQHHHCKCSAP